MTTIAGGPHPRPSRTATTAATWAATNSPNSHPATTGDRPKRWGTSRVASSMTWGTTATRLATDSHAASRRRGPALNATEFDSARLAVLGFVLEAAGTFGFRRLPSVGPSQPVGLHQAEPHLAHRG